MRTLLLSAILIAGCSAPAVVPSTPVADNSADLRKRLTELETHVATIDRYVSGLRKAVAKPPATPPDIQAITAETAAEVGRLTPDERRQAKEAVTAMLAGRSIPPEQRGIASKLDCCRRLLGESAIRELRASPQAEMKWAADNLTPDQANRALAAGPFFFANTLEVLSKGGVGGDIDAMAADSAEEVLGWHPAIDKLRGRSADAELVEMLVKAQLAH